jgi:hypothetical protein
VSNPDFQVGSKFRVSEAFVAEVLRLLFVSSHQVKITYFSHALQSRGTIVINRGALQYDASEEVWFLGE